jgi:hypothetical protein
MDKRYCTNCGTFNPPDAAFCANCGGYLTGSPPQPASSSGSFPSLDEAILRKLRDLVFPITGKKLFAGGGLIILFFALVAVAVASNNHGFDSAPAVTLTPTPMAPTSTHARSVETPSSTPKATSTPKASASQPTGERDEKAGQLEDLLVQQGMTVVTPFTKHVNKNDNDVYTGTFKDSKYAYDVTIEVCKSPDYSASLYNEQVAQLKSKGFSTYNSQESKELWIGYNANSKQSVEVKRFTGTDGTLYLSTMFAKKQ